jgi:hypothetical protein
VIDARLPQSPLALGDLVVELVDQMQRGGSVGSPWLGQLQPVKQSRPPTPNTSDTGQGWPNASRVA